MTGQGCVITMVTTKANFAIKNVEASAVMVNEHNSEQYCKLNVQHTMVLEYNCQRTIALFMKRASQINHKINTNVKYKHGINTWDVTSVCCALSDKQKHT